MNVKRNKFLEIVVADVMRGGYNTYKKYSNGDWQWSLHKGNKTMYSWDKDVPCVTIEFNNVNMTTIVNNQTSVIDVAEYLFNHELNFNKKKDLAQKVGEYCNKNSWTS